MAEDTYSCNAKVEHILEDMFVIFLTDNFELPEITTNIRRAGDTTTGRDMPGIAVLCMADLTLKGCFEYHVLTQIIFETSADDDDDTQQILSMIGIVRDLFSQTGTDGKTIVDYLNATRRGFVIHADGFDKPALQPPDDSGRTRRRILEVDIHGYVGTES